LKEEIKKLVTSGTWPRSMVDIGTHLDADESHPDPG
jgi:hypothetical protein